LVKIGEINMSGIARIQSRIQERLQTQNVDSKEYFLRDGDQVFLSAAGDGKEGDPFVSEIQMLTWREGNRFRSVLITEDDDVDKIRVSLNIPEDSRVQKKFAMWVHIYEALHVERRVDSWTAIEGPSGKTLYKEELNDFRIMALPFGRGGYVWNQLVDVFEEWGTLNKGVIRVKRNGAGLETTYSIAASTRELSTSDKDTSELISIDEYYKNRYSADLETGKESKDVSLFD
tara:strand:+ start:1243 stop:1935 length:693 start_codon:yes stop_codon:yes gene_type:complete